MQHKIQIKFSKKGVIKYISHLDLMRLFARVLRRSGLPFYLTKGFNPHPKFSIKRALKVGIESDNEEAVFVLKEEISLDEFRQRFQEQLPEGIEIRHVQRNSY